MNATNYVRETIDLVKQIETRFLELGARLFNIREKKLWQESYDYYADFLETAKINPGHASIFEKIHRFYVVEGKKEIGRLARIGYTNLYEAIPLIEKDGLEKAIIKAETLTRSEIKDEVRDHKVGEHDHEVGEERWGMCKKCNKFIRLWRLARGEESS